jgi:protein-tyrosine phosphatase
MRGAAADAPARRGLPEAGSDDEGHCSRVATEEILPEADLIVAMEERQRQFLQEQFPSLRDKVRLLKSYLPGQDPQGEEANIKDPYRRSLFAYRLCFAEISLAVEELRKCI